jgi:hypothetical protein
MQLEFELNQNSICLNLVLIELDSNLIQTPKLISNTFNGI